MNVHMQDLLSKEKSQTIAAALDVAPLLKGRRDVAAEGPLDVRLTARGEGGLVLVEGELNADLELNCSRCLTPLHRHLTVPFDEQFKPASSAESDEEEEDSVSVEGDRLDLQPYVEEAFLLELPFAPLCSDACKGLCPQCGNDLNANECGCSRERIDPRMAALKDLFKEDK